MSSLPVSLDSITNTLNTYSDQIDSFVGQSSTVSTKALVVTGGALASYQLWKLTSYLYRHFFAYSGLPGPKRSHWFFGNIREMMGENTHEVQKQWVEQYGSTFVVHNILGGKRLFTTDTRALSHILLNTYDYPRSDEARFRLARIMGHGLLFAEGDQHKLQRKVMNPAFGPIQLRELTQIFVEKSNLLRDAWLSEIAKTSSNRVDVLDWLSKMTLDVIGLAGFNYNFNALNPDAEPNELNEAFGSLFRAGGSPVAMFLAMWLPFLDWLPRERGRQVATAKGTMARIGRELLAESKAAALEEQKSGKKSRARDLLTLLVKANMAEGANNMSDEDVLAQIPTFLVAGHETTSTATSWALMSIAENPDIQARLREEIASLGTDTPTMDELSEGSLPYLDAVVRESLRLHSPVPFAARKAARDDVIPLGTPYTDGRGRVHTELRVEAENTMIVPIYAMNTAEEIWGSDATVFNPERWMQGGGPEKAHGLPGVWGHQMTFLGGQHACIGYKFSLFEMKALLFSLVKAFEFELAVPVSDIGVRQTVVRRPIVKSQKEKGAQMPLLIKPIPA
ncbi:cytochrome P450 [Coniophora puteana RWD-64-598 SS2]|uniref:Cytochrome P450 n=1 Tax=Coniophora puteana (strain RWD-64-598) TaxID=741705 RepID=A0A5M3M9N1_CONPW|nr:cytochrome P450 [Coniophora puteana RWD-64-598 SS2]EIW75992.1 cytochrome P450 [Coniophora puteana RWD-64-598 SS2]